MKIKKKMKSAQSHPYHMLEVNWEEKKQEEKKKREYSEL